MADFNVGDVVRLGVVLKYDLLYDIVNTWHFQITAGPGWTASAAYTSIQAYVDALYTYLTTYMSNRVTADHIQVKNMTQDTIWGAIAFGSWTGGSGAGDPTALQVALLGYGRTQISRVQIRKYLGVFTESDMTLGLWSGSLRGAADNMMSYHVNQQTLTGTMSVKGCAYNPTIPRVTFATSVNTSGAPVVQRRRRVGRGS